MVSGKLPLSEFITTIVVNNFINRTWLNLFLYFVGRLTVNEVIGKVKYFKWPCFKIFMYIDFLL